MLLDIFLAVPGPERHLHAVGQVGLCEQHQLGQVYPLPGQLGGPVDEAVRRQEHVEAGVVLAGVRGLVRQVVLLLLPDPLAPALLLALGAPVGEAAGAADTVLLTLLLTQLMSTQCTHTLASTHLRPH